MTRTKILVAGIGNVFLGDDAFGVEVVRRLACRSLPAGVHVKDFGIRGIDLAYALLDGYETVVLVDAVSRGEAAGTLFLMEPEITEAASGLNTHSIDPMEALRLATTLGGPLPRMFLLGCEPQSFEPQYDMCAGLSPPVRAAVQPAVARIERFLHELLEPQNRTIQA